MASTVTQLRLALNFLLVMGAVSCLQPTLARGQAQFYTTPPDIDSFPIVKTTISVAYNGRPAPITAAHLSLQEDGQPTPFELLDCDGSESASIAMLVDVSESMKFTLWKGSDEFYKAFADFANVLPITNELALIPFNDTVARIIPATYRSQDFFNTENPSDLAEFIDSIGGLQFAGNTDVDFAIWQAAQHLKKGVHKRKAIVLVTDDAIYDYQGLIALLKQEDIPLFVLELDGDTIRGNILTADASGGKFFSPRDSTEIGPMMIEIASAIFAKKCTLRYVSRHPCPWWSRKTLWLGLNYQPTGSPMIRLAQTHYFHLGANLRDSIAPLLSETNINELSRRVTATEMFPCERGIMSLTDSALVNFAKLSRIRQMPIMAYDSLVVADPARAADGFYIAIDSNGNTSKIRISYTPPLDLLPPAWSLSTRVAPEQYQIVATELRKSDRGLWEILLDPTSENSVLDSVRYLSHKIAHAYVSRIDPNKEAHACLIAVDSAGNDSSTCMYFRLTGGDIHPPLISQVPLESPYVTIAADITELRPGDRGIEEIIAIAVSNVTSSSIAYSNAYVASATLTIIDSMYPASATVTARDSAGNIAEQLLTYVPLPDERAPQYTITNVDNVTRGLSVTEIQPWDRGIETVLSIQTTNVNAVKLSDSKHVVDWEIQLTDPYTGGSARFEATDSAGNLAEISVIIPAQTKPALKPLTYSDPLDFGSLAAPAYSKRFITLSNPNGEAIALVSADLTGDDSVLASLSVLPMIIPANGTVDLPFEYAPVLLGKWKAIYTIETDEGVKYPIRLNGSSTGALTITASHEAVALSGESGELVISFSGAPDVSNLDTMNFLLSLNEDVAALGAPTSTCATDSWLCNYDLSWSDMNNGSYNVHLIRKSPKRSLELGAAPKLRIPFRTFLSEHLSTAVLISSGYASRSTVSTSTGSIAMGDACGDSVIRASIGRAAGSVIRHVDLKDNKLSVTYESSSSSSATIKVIDLLGKIRYHSINEVTSGLNNVVIPVADLSSGQYQLVILTSGGSVARSFTVLR